MNRFTGVLSRAKATACIALAVFASAFAATTAFPATASAAWWEPSTPWNGNIFIYCLEDYVYQSDSLTFTMDIWDVGPNTDGLQLDVSLTDQYGNELRWDDLDPSRQMQVGTGFGHARDFTVGSDALRQLQPGTVTIATHLQYFNGSTGSWMDTAQPYSSTTFVLYGGNRPAPLPEFPLPGCFADMQDPNDWRYDGVYAVAAAGLITGYDNGLFGVDDSLTTAQLITILWRYAEPEESSSTDTSSTLNETYLIDVADFQYYTAAVNWAFENGVVHGYQTPAGYRLDPDAPVSTERAMTILANYLTADEPAMSDQEVEGFLMKCVDGSSVSEWARPSIAWALKTRMISGYDTAYGRESRPWENIARGRFAVILDNGMETGALPPNTSGIIPE